uniref:Ubiquitin carboxyl-terminal hydrolase n=1 Tax=Neobodo designis TaxID=312471 RepID=A0A7S1QIG8_NEODS|mmetsp:Transcript_46148/g.142217  ORF Transcript_46148/g.142217 Transcript_46148/m.142217 type:complete len:822 (+) Transcript_46148:76-2541(+)
MSAATPVDLTTLSRELLPRRITFVRERVPDIAERPKKVINLNPKDAAAAARVAGAPSPSAPGGQNGVARAGGDFGPLPPNWDEEDPLFAVPEAVMVPIARAVSVRWPKVSGAGCGLQNLGNTCFMNSVLQAIAYTPPLATYLQNVERDRNSRTFDALGALGDVCRQIHAGGHRYAFKPSAIAGSLRTLLSHRHFRPGQQADAHEFAIRILDACQIALVKRLVPGRKLTSLAEYTSPLMRVIGGFLCSQVSWKREDELRSLRKMRSPQAEWVAREAHPRHYTSNTYEPSCILHLPVAGQTLDDCARKFCSLDKIDGYKTDRGGIVQVTRGTRLHRLPKVLIVHLKRFDNAMRKINKHIAFPAHDEVWDVAPYMTPQARQAGCQCTKYQLHAVVLHHGSSLGFGHYTAMVRAPNGIFYEADDGHVHNVPHGALKKAPAYMLFYVQVEDVKPPKAAASPATKPAQPSAADGLDFGVEVPEPAPQQKRASPRASPATRPAPPPVTSSDDEDAEEAEYEEDAEEEEAGDEEVASEPAATSSSDDEAAEEPEERPSFNLVGTSRARINHAAANVTPTHKPAKPPIADDESESEQEAAPKQQKTGAAPELDSDEEPIDDTPTGRIVPARLSAVAEDGTQSQPAVTMKKFRNAARGVVQLRKVHREPAKPEANDAEGTEPASVKKSLVEALRSAGEQPSALRKKAFQGTFAVAQRDQQYDAEFDKGRVKKTRAERRREAEAKGKLLPGQGLDGRNRFQEKTNIMVQRKARGEDWLDDAPAEAEHGNNDDRRHGRRGRSSSAHQGNGHRGGPPGKRNRAEGNKPRPKWRG